MNDFHFHLHFKSDDKNNVYRKTTVKSALALVELLVPYLPWTGSLTAFVAPASLIPASSASSFLSCLDLLSNEEERLRAKKTS